MTEDEMEIASRSYLEQRGYVVVPPNFKGTAMVAPPIMRAVCLVTNLKAEQVRSARSIDRLLRARGLFMTVGDQLGMHPAEIGRLINRDRTTVCHHLSTGHYAPDPDLVERCMALVRRFQAEEARDAA